MLRFTVGSLLFAAWLHAAGLVAAAPKIYVVHTSREVCTYMRQIVAVPCRQAVLVQAESQDAATEGFKVSLVYRGTTGGEKTLTQMVAAAPHSGGAKAAATFYLDDITVVSASAAVVAPVSDAAVYPEGQ